jgi:hypothetical protein
MENTILQRVPNLPVKTDRYLFYLHGLIVEEAGIRPKSDEHGYYEYEGILQELAQEGFVVISEARAKGTEIRSYAENLVTEIRFLLDNKVPPENISVVGASKGGVIAAYVSLLLAEKDVNFVFLAGLFEKCLTDAHLKLYGKVLSIHDKSDKLTQTPQLYFQRSTGLGTFKEIILDLGLGHGLIYQPHRQWLDPLFQWLKPRPQPTESREI